eukprot:Pgem_evm1s7583
MNRLPFPTIGLFLLGCYSGMTLIRLIENPENFRGIKSLLGFKTEEEEAEELFKKRQMKLALVLLLECATPVAINLVVLCSIQENREKEMMS